ncbi:MAG: hypothetical protein ABJS57_16370 [Algibacter sp.]
MKSKITFIILTLILVSCKQTNKSESQTHKLTQIEITDKFKLEFLNQILSDSSKFKIILDKKVLISNFSINIPPTLPVDKNNPQHTISHSEFISDTLKINDIDFVKGQFQKNKSFDISRIKEYGFNVIDIKKYTENKIDWDSINKIEEKYYTENSDANIYSILYITKPIFNKELNLAYVRIRQGSGGMTRIYEKQNEIWRMKYEFDEWVE